MKKFIQIHPNDNVVVVLENLHDGEEVVIKEQPVILKEDVFTGHKIALVSIPTGQPVIKYGQPIGKAKTDIEPGDWIHTHNMSTILSGKDKYKYEPDLNVESQPKSSLVFNGFAREDGSVGIRNEIWIIPTVGCVNKVAEALARQCQSDPKFKHVDGVHAFTHPYGCSQLGEDHESTQKLLSSLVHHPNAGGVLVLGLGCENNTMDSFKEVIGPVSEDRVRFLVSQDVENEMETGLDYLEQLAEYVNQFKRQPVPLSALKIGLKCGGSDGLSGITANSLVGVLSDRLVAAGGTTIMSEVPEMFGAEKLLMNRCINADVFDKCVNMVNGFKDYFIKYDQPVYENPSPGNKKGGISTLEEKSLGCTQKGGSSPVVDVLKYGDRVKKSGLNLLSGPGNDIVAVTVLAASGAHLILFTTGRGTPLGGPVPTVKISTNSDLARRKKHWIDFNAGQLLENITMNDLSEQLLQYVIEIASGRINTSNEIHDFREIAIFKDGVTL